MSNSQYQPIQPVHGFSPLQGENASYYNSPDTYSHPWTGAEGDLGSPGYEMRNTSRLSQPNTRDSSYSFQSFQTTAYDAKNGASAVPPRPVPSHAYSSSTLFNSSNESDSFLHDPLNKIDTTYASSVFGDIHQPTRAKSGKQVRRILFESSFRWFITAGLCAAYYFAVQTYVKKSVLSEPKKKEFNAITTAISIALGLNIASAYKDMALNMRWVILSRRKPRNLEEMDLILSCDSLTKMAKLALVARRPWVILACVLWLVINIAAQSGIAAVGLTYGFDSDYSRPLMVNGNVSIPNMDHFFPNGNNTNPSLQDEQFTAHLYGGLAYNYGLNETQYMPSAGDVVDSSNALLWYDYDRNHIEYIFQESSPKSSIFSIYTNRTVNITYFCNAYTVTKNGDATSTVIGVANVGDVYVSNSLNGSITFFTDYDNQCNDDPRCTIVQAFEASSTDPWYYTCNITLGHTQNDSEGLASISDSMAAIATASIAQLGYQDEQGQQAQIYPGDSLWGYPCKGDKNLLGNTIAAFGLGSISGAAMLNPSFTHPGQEPIQGSFLDFNHPFWFYLVLGLIAGSHLVFCVIVAILANQVQVGPDGHLDMSMLLRPIADKLYGVSNGIDNKAFRRAKKETKARYEKGRSDNERWTFVTS
ncbi:hypothetical protein F5884DRAFT_226998 [Xylogone sp. PMI_703]|nr:hypothetical protein F5884DRAFT_226998 [Xylogone sp. PMI_703]